MDILEATAILDQLKCMIGRGTPVKPPPSREELRAQFASVDKLTPRYGDIVVLTLPRDVSLQQLPDGRLGLLHASAIPIRKNLMDAFGYFWHGTRYKFEGATCIILEHGSQLSLLNDEDLKALGLQRIPERANGQAKSRLNTVTTDAESH